MLCMMTCKGHYSLSSEVGRDGCRACTCPKAQTHIGISLTHHRLRKKFQRKIVNIFLPINFNICFGCSKEPSYLKGLLSTHNICFCLRNKKHKYSLCTLMIDMYVCHAVCHKNNRS